MNIPDTLQTCDYPKAMGQFLVLYTQVDRLIMEVCARRLTEAPDEAAELSLAKEVGDESRHVALQRQWMRQFGTDTSPLITPQQEQMIRAHFQGLPWMDFLADLYVCVEALGSEAVEQVVPSLRIPLAQEPDHVSFGITRLKQELARLSQPERDAFFQRLPGRIDALVDLFQGFGFPLRELFESVGADYGKLCVTLDRRRTELLDDLAHAA